MPVLARRPNWEQQLRDSSAIQQLLAARPDRFPLAEVQKITDDLLEWTQTAFARRRITPWTEDCDIFLVNEINKVKNEVAAHEAGIVACVHAFTYDQARGQLVHLRPRPQDLGVFFKTKLHLYLQCIILAAKSNRQGVFSDCEAAAARDLLSVARGSGTKPLSIGRLLHAVGQDSCEELLPLDLVRVVLSRNHYGDNLVRELEQHRQSRRWLSAYKLVRGVRHVVGLPRACEILQEFFPDYLTWGSWQPDKDRLQLWERLTETKQREKLFPVLDLEGPDMTGQQRGTLGMSTPGIFKDYPAAMNDRSIVDRVLKLLDKSIIIGPGAVELFNCICLDSNRLTPRALEQMDAALDLSNSSAAATLAHFITYNPADSPILDRVITFTKAIPIIQSSSGLQKHFGLDLERNAPMTLSAGQKHLCMLLQQKSSSERFASSVRALGQVLLDATWLHSSWQPAYIEMLKQIPSQGEISLIYRELKSAQVTARQAYADLLASKLGASRRRAHSVQGTPIVLTPEDPIWHQSLDVDREALRTKLRTRWGGNKPLITLCLQQALVEHDTFVRELNGILVDDTDQVCVNLASFLGSRMATPQKVHQHWKSLLLCMMRQRPPNLLERCGQQLLLQSWLRWVEDLRRLYGDRHLDPDGGLGFTGEKFMQWSQRKIGVGRSHSTSTMATVSSVGTANTGWMSFVSEYAEDVR